MPKIEEIVEKTINEKVIDQYKNYPYPEYNYKNDLYAPKRFPLLCGQSLDEINHYLFNGKKKTYDNFSFLSVGVGIGNEVICIGSLLKYYKNTRIVGIDLSDESLKICKERLEKYELENVELINMSLLDLNPEKMGKFDFISSHGVLHHLENPVKGLSALKSVLKDDGGMNIMVYGKIGRTAIYQMQDLLKKINKYEEEDNFKKKINNFNNLYQFLPHNNWFRFSESFISDHKVSDSGIVDLLLHCQDRAYTIPELYDWVNGCGLEIVDFIGDERSKLECNLLKLTKNHKKKEKYAINELYFGDIIKHHFYISKKKNAKAKIEDLENIMIPYFITEKTLKTVSENSKDVKKFNFNNFPLNIIINDELYSWGYANFRIPVDDDIRYILKSINNKYTTKEIFDNLRKDLKKDTSDKDLIEKFKPVYNTFELFNIILLRK